MKACHWGFVKFISCIWLTIGIFGTSHSGFADEIIDPYVNVEEQGGGYALAYTPLTAITLPFDPNNYMFLIYESASDENSIRAAMEKIGIPTSRYTICDKDHPVTLNLLDNHDILIVGWESSSNATNKAGLTTSAIEQGITGRVILSGHDSDYHTVNEEAEDAATTFFIQEIEYILNGGGTGLLVCADPQLNLDWLPESWAVTANNNSGTEVTDFTQDGLGSGIFDGLTEELMSGWSTTYHNTFAAWGDGFKVFELGETNTSEIGYDVVTIAAPICPTGFDFQKYDDVSVCADLNAEFTYTLEWHNATEQTFCSVSIYDFLPEGVSFLHEIVGGQPAGDPNEILDPNEIWECIMDPNCVLPAPSPTGPECVYDEPNHMLIWELVDPIEPNDTGSVSFLVRVNEKSQPGLKLHNVADMYTNDTFLARATKDTQVCDWDPIDPNIIYVDHTATGNNNGIDWQNAYTSLDDALYRARESAFGENFLIYAAQGTYAPTDATNGFVLPSGCSVFGGYPTGGGDYSSPKKYETILSGLIDEDEFPDAAKVVTMGDASVLDGVTVTKADLLGYGVYGNGVDFTLSHSVVKENFGYGVYAENGNVSVQWTTINSNAATGLYHQGHGYFLTVENSWCLRNGEHGIFSLRSTPYVKNSIISESSLSAQGRQGIRMEKPTHQPKLYNLTIANNKAQALYFEDDGDADGDPNNLDYPDLQNSILFFNNNNGNQITGFSPDLHANFCCIQDCNEPGTTNYNDEPGFAYAVDPNGAPDPNNYHLAYNSFCINKGNDLDLDYTGQVDIDGEGENRQYGSAVDIGADEVYDCYDDYLSDADVHNDLDFDADGVVGLTEFTLFSAAWLTYDPNHPYCDPNNPNYVSDPNAPGYIDEEDKLRFNPICDLDEDLHVGLTDIIAFADEWLWVACWRADLWELMAQQAMMSGGEQQMQSFDTGLMETEAVQAIPGPEIVQPELTVEEQILQLQDAIVFLEQIWREEPDLQQEINAEDWQAFMDAIYQNLADLQTGIIQIE